MVHSIKHSLVYKLILTTGFCLAMVLPLDNKAQVAVSIGIKIRALRQRLKRTLDEVATTAGISKPFLSQVERGHATPSITSLVGIARALGVTVQYFVDTPTEDKSVRQRKRAEVLRVRRNRESFWTADEPGGRRQAGSNSRQDAGGTEPIGSHDARRGRVLVRDERPDIAHVGRYNVRIAGR